VCVYTFVHTTIIVPKMRRIIMLSLLLLLLLSIIIFVSKAGTHFLKLGPPLCMTSPLAPEESEYFGMEAALNVILQRCIITHPILCLETLLDPEIRKILNDHHGVVLARVGNHPFWPARV
jgi:hypothetical protein